MVIRKRQVSAFTLIELVIVVGILMILTAIGAYNYLEAQTRAKVARVKVDLRTVSIAVESFETDHGEYPGNRPSRCLMHPPPEPPESRPTDWLANFWCLTTPIAYLPKVRFEDPFIRPRQKHKHLAFNDRTALFWYDPKLHRETMPTIDHEWIYCPPMDPREPLAHDPQYTYILAVSPNGFMRPESRDVEEFDGKKQGDFDYLTRFEDSELRRPYYFVTSVGPDKISGPDAVSGRLWTSYNYTWGNDYTQRNIFTGWQYDPSNGTISGGDIIRYFTE